MSEGIQNQSVVNVILDENNSQNFFTNLNETNIHQNEKEIQLNDQDNHENEKSIELNKEIYKSNEMLERVNCSQKIIGHNRFQQKIEELENFIEKDKKYKAEQEMKVNLFKKTISSLQAQLQQRSNLERPQDNNNIKLIEEQSETIKQLTLDISKFKLERESLTNQLNTYLSDINRLKDENTFIIKKYDDIKNEYDLLNKNYQEKNYILENTISDKLTLQNKLNFELSLKENLESELLLLKSHSKTIELEKIISNKNIIIDKLNSEIIEIDQNRLLKQENVKKEIKQVVKLNIPGNSRGLTNTTRGTNRQR